MRINNFFVGTLLLVIMYAMVVAPVCAAQIEKDRLVAVAEAEKELVKAENKFTKAQGVLEEAKDKVAFSSHRTDLASKAFEQARADFEQARADFEQARADFEQARAEKVSAQSTAKLLEKTEKMQRELSARHEVLGRYTADGYEAEIFLINAQKDFENAQVAVEAAKHKLDAVKEAVTVSDIVVDEVKKKVGKVNDKGKQLLSETVSSVPGALLSPGKAIGNAFANKGKSVAKGAQKTAMGAATSLFKVIAAWQIFLVTTFGSANYIWQQSGENWPQQFLISSSIGGMNRPILKKASMLTFSLHMPWRWGSKYDVTYSPGQSSFVSPVPFFSLTPDLLHIASLSEKFKVLCIHNRLGGTVLGTVISSYFGFVLAESLLGGGDDKKKDKKDKEDKED